MFSKYLKTPIAGVALVAMIAFGAPAAAADLPDDPVVAESDWQFIVGIPGFLPWVSGDVRTGPVTSSIDVSPDTLLESLRFAVMVDAEVIYAQQFTLALDLFYANVGGAIYAVGGSRVALGFSETIFEGRAGYRLLQDHMSWLEGYVGLRYWDIDASLTIGPPLGPLAGASGDSWVDPFIGLRGRYALAPHWALIGMGDIGGFGAGSDFSWRLQAGVEYDFGNGWIIDLEWKAIQVDYDNKEPGPSRFAFDVLQQGPLVRVAYKF